MSAIVIYFSRTGENYVNGTIKRLSVGNTETAARIIAELTGADTFKIEPVTAYSDNYSECIQEAKQDQHRNARSELQALPAGLERYDTVYLGYPNYWGTMPMAMFTLLEQCNFDGKTIKPFCTHEGSGLGRSVEDIKKLCPRAKVAAGLAIRGANAANARQQIENWI